MGLYRFYFMWQKCEPTGSVCIKLSYDCLCLITDLFNVL